MNCSPSESTERYSRWATTQEVPVWDQDVVHEILHEAQGKAERKYHVKCSDTIVLGKHLAMFKKEGYKTES